TSWSNFGRCVDLWAPGKKIFSTKMGGGYRRMSGTSMAAPHAGGTAALYLSSRPHVPPAIVESVLRNGSERTDEKSKDGRRIRLVDAGRY
ncbi:MAG TPA: S8 family serine peptidase, partial [Rubrobacteraceae bacterium]|nr:S8 family serine peptidase [Rubrobacteraceae bacterium]